MAHDARTIKVLFVDLDGTLLNSNAEISAGTSDAIGRCTETGIRVVMATARPPRSTQPLYDRLGLTALSIHYNGALVYDFATGRTLLHNPMPGVLAKELFDCALRVDQAAAVSLEVCDRLYQNRRPEHIRTKTDLLGFEADYVGDLSDFFEQPVTKVLASFPTAGSNAAEAALMSALGDRLTFTRSDEGLIHAMNAGVSKGNAAEFVMEKLGVAKEETAAIGDAPNDIPMLKSVGLAIAMGNAYAETKQAADYVTQSNDMDGVAVAIRRMILGRGGG